MPEMHVFGLERKKTTFLPKIEVYVLRDVTQHMHKHCCVKDREIINFVKGFES